MHIRAGQEAVAADLIDVEAVLDAYYSVKPDLSDATKRVSFGTSGHRGSSLTGSFNEDHIRAIAQAIAEIRKENGVSGPLFIGADTHALSAPALKTAVQVLLAHGVRVLVSEKGAAVPTPALSHAIICHNKNVSGGFADGIVVTPSHNPPADGGFKYNSTHGGPADESETAKIEARANEILANRSFMPGALEDFDVYERAESFDFQTPYVAQLNQIIDVEAIKKADIKIAVHPLAGAAYHYWQAIAAKWQLKLDVLGPAEDPQWSFMTLDWDGKIRMDPSSSNVMQVTAKLQNNYDLLLANDADADRFGIITKTGGLINPNHVLAVSAKYLLDSRTAWQKPVGVGKTVVSSAIIDRTVAKAGGTVYEVPVGFKWFVAGLTSGALSFAGEESAGASFVKFDGTAWSTDKDGIIMGLLAAEITAVTGLSIDQHYAQLTSTLGDPQYSRVDAPATPAEKTKLKALDAAAVTENLLADDPIIKIETSAAGNGSKIGGLKVATENAWFAARPSGTENVYKIYAESFIDEKHLARVLEEAQKLVAASLRLG